MLADIYILLLIIVLAIALGIVNIWLPYCDSKDMSSYYLLKEKFNELSHKYKDLKEDLRSL
jgi:hypothetical protein